MGFELLSTSEFLNGGNKPKVGPKNIKTLPNLLEVKYGETVESPAKTSKFASLPTAPQPKSKSVAHAPHDPLPILNSGSPKADTFIASKPSKIEQQIASAITHDGLNQTIADQTQTLSAVVSTQDVVQSELTNTFKVVDDYSDLNATQQIKTFDAAGNPTREIPVQSLASETKTIKTFDAAGNQATGEFEAFSAPRTFNVNGDTATFSTKVAPKAEAFVERKPKNVHELVHKGLIDPLTLGDIELSPESTLELKKGLVKAKAAILEGKGATVENKKGLRDLFEYLKAPSGSLEHNAEKTAAGSEVVKNVVAGMHELLGIAKHIK